MKFPIPLHPVLVHFPIALYFLELVLITFWIAKKDEHYKQFARFAFRFAFLMMLAAMFEGLEDAGWFAHMKGRILIHASLATSVLILQTARGFFWHFGKEGDSSYRWTHFLFSGAGNILIALTGFYGGLLVYGR